MTAREWYVIDKRSNTIVNCITAHSEPSLAGFVDPENLRLDPNPPLSMLKQYQYWNERP